MLKKGKIAYFFESVEKLLVLETEDPVCSVDCRLLQLLLYNQNMPGGLLLCCTGINFSQERK